MCNLILRSYLPPSIVTKLFMNTRMTSLYFQILPNNKNFKPFYLKIALPLLISILSSAITTKRSLLGKVIKHPFIQIVTV